MNLNPRVVSSAAALAFSCVMSAAAYYYKSRYSELNEVMVFCKLQYNVHNYFDKLISYLEIAKHNINVCMPGIHNPAIQNRLIELIRKKKVDVRIIIDPPGCNDSTDVFLNELLEAGAEIRCKKIHNVVPYRIQHKFCLIDDKILMTGTLNWGDDRTSDHWNYIYITSKQQLVQPIVQEFNKMWNNLVHIHDRQPVPFDTSSSMDTTVNESRTTILAQSDCDSEGSNNSKSATPNIII